MKFLSLAPRDGPCIVRRVGDGGVQSAITRTLIRRGLARLARVDRSTLANAAFASVPLTRLDADKAAPALCTIMELL